MTPPQIYEKCAPAVVEIYNYDNVKDQVQNHWSSEGSGWIYRMPSGKTIAITAAHVIASVGGIYSVEDQYRHKYTITGIWKSPLYDMGYVSITGWHGPTLTFSSQKVEVGMKLYNIGFPLGVEQPYLSEGYVASGKTGFKDGISTTNYMTVFLDSTSGDSGSPILDKNGHVLGLVDMESGEFQRLIFCLPAETVQKEIKSS